MIGLDTNVLVRYLAQDHAMKSPRRWNASCSGCTATLTFDKKAKRLKQFQLLVPNSK
jgi:predicted nucleic-acid-binding protein